MSEIRAVRVGPVHEDERDAVRALWCEYRAYIQSLYPFEPFDDAEIAALPGQIYVLRDGAGVAGCVALREFAEGVVEIKRLYVSPTARGGGAGRRLTEHAIAEARRQGYRLVRLDTLEAMTGAIALYRSLGFREIENYHGRPLRWALFFEMEL